MECPRCGFVFLATGLSSYGFSSRDTDGRPNFWGLNPLPFFVKVCPHCEYAAFTSDFILKPSLTEEREKEMEVYLKYELAGTHYEKIGLKLEAARAYHHAAWVLVDQGELQEAKSFYLKAANLYLEYFLKSDEIYNLYLSGECFRRAGETLKARKVFEEILSERKDLLKASENGEEIRKLTLEMLERC
ncbi:MAG: DUF2225 domain-containing protein [Candidatus Methanofastidiosia archaeon]